MIVFILDRAKDSSSQVIGPFSGMIKLFGYGLEVCFAVSYS